MKILCLPYTHALSHLSRPLLVAQELAARGHELIFAGESPKKVFIETEGFTVLPLHEPDPGQLFGNIRARRMRFIDEAEIERMVAADLALYEAVHPDLVLSDGRFSAPISTQIDGIKHAAIVNVSSTTYRALPYIPFFEWTPEWLLNRKTRLWSALETLNLGLEMKIFDNVMEAFTRLSRRYRLAKPVTASNCLVGADVTLLADAPEYFPTKNLPGEYHYIGPLTWKSKLPAPVWWPPSRKGALIYITMGTTGITDFFHKVYELIRSSDMSAIISTGNHTTDLVSIAGKIYLEPYIDGDLAIESCDAVVCHGGNGTIYQALHHAKPIIAIPTLLDQAFNARRVEALGVGKLLSWEQFQQDPKRLLALIQNVIHQPSFRHNAVALRAGIIRYNAPKAAADILETIKPA